ncbi:MAG: hypothetical protein ACWGQW_15080 [bacterium]
MLLETYHLLEFVNERLDYRGHTMVTINTSGDLVLRVSAIYGEHAYSFSKEISQEVLEDVTVTDSEILEWFCDDVNKQMGKTVGGS